VIVYVSVELKTNVLEIRSSLLIRVDVGNDYKPLMCVCVCYRTQDSSVSIATGCGLDSQGSIPSRGRDFSLLHSVQTDSGAHPASYPMDTRALFSGVKWLGHEADHTPPSSVEVMNGGAVYVSVMPHSVGALGNSRAESNCAVTTLTLGQLLEKDELYVLALKLLMS
jgi:hypothetical protein